MYEKVHLPDVIKSTLEDDVVAYKKSKLVIFIGTMPDGRKHLSISHPSRFPTWDEIKDARYALLPDDIDMAMYLPSQSKYVNVHNNCFHLFQCTCYKGE